MFPLLLLSLLPFRHPFLFDTRPASITNQFTIPGQAFPTSLVDISTLSATVGGAKLPPAATTICVTSLVVSVTGQASAVNLTIQDQQTSAWKFFDAVPITPTSSTQGTTWVVIGAGTSQADSQAVAPCVIFTGGMKVQAGGAGATIQVGGWFL